jgi:hypothetical protein
LSDLVTIFESGNPALVALAKSLLESEGIEFTTKGDALQDILGLGRFPTGANLLAGPVEFQVLAGDAAKAKSLLSDLGRGEEGNEPA